MRRDTKPLGTSTAGSKPFVRSSQAGSVDKTTVPSSTTLAMHNMKLAAMSTEGMNIAGYSYGLPPGTEIDLHNSVYPGVREYAKIFRALAGSPGPVSATFDHGMMTVRSKWAADPAPLFSMHQTDEGIRYAMQGHPLNGSSSFEAIKMAQAHLSICKFISHEAVDLEGARLQVARIAMEMEKQRQAEIRRQLQ